MEHHEGIEDRKPRAIEPFTHRTHPFCFKGLIGLSACPQERHAHAAEGHDVHLLQRDVDPCRGYAMLNQGNPQIRERPMMIVQVVFSQQRNHPPPRRWGIERAAGDGQTAGNTKRGLQGKPRFA